MDLMVALSLLGLGKLGLNTPITLDQIKKAYRIKAKITHPDKGGSKNAFVKVKDAYDFLMAAGQDILARKNNPGYSKPVDTSWWRSQTVWYDSSATRVYTAYAAYATTHVNADS